MKNVIKKVKIYSFFTCQTSKYVYTSVAPRKQRSAVSGSVAQLVEQRIENPRVGGSNPSRATLFVST